MTPIFFNVKNLQRDKKPQALSNQIIHYEEKNSWVQGLTWTKSFILSQTTCLKPSSFSYHHSSLGKHLESTPSFDLGLFLSPRKKSFGFYPNKMNMRARMKNTMNQPILNKDFSLKNWFSIQTYKFFHKANTLQYSKKNLMLKNPGFSLS